jgi:hypothetical protein
MFNIVLLVGIALTLPASGSQPVAPFELLVKGGGSRGTLVFDTNGVSYKAENPTKSRQWSYHELKQIRVVSPRELAFDTFEDGRRWRFGADRTIDFDVSQGAIDGRLMAFLLEHVERPVTSVVLPTGLGEPRSRVSVKHLRRNRGTHGTLGIYASGLSYETEGEADSRYWRFSDIESVLRISPFRLLVNVYERGSVRTLAFELKSPLPRPSFDYLWQQVNLPTDRTERDR